MDAIKEHRLPNDDPKGNRGGRPTIEPDSNYARIQRRAPAPKVEVSNNANQSQFWKAPDTDHQVTNQDEQRKITNTENADNAISETDA